MLQYYHFLTSVNHRLETDASDTGIGAVLSKVIEGKKKVISYASRCLSRTEQKYCVTWRELLAVVTII